jgi:ribosomal protein S14
MYKKKVYKDVQVRNRLKRLEIDKVLLKYLVFSRHLNANVNYNSIKEILYNKIFFIKNSISQIKNICLISKRPNSVYRDFKMNRTQLKYFANRGLLPGVKRGS